MSNYKNGPKEINRIPRMRDAVLECLIRDSLFYELANRYEGENRDRLHGLMHDTAEEVLARVSLTAPVASAAPSGELPACALIYSGARYWSEEQMQAAIAHQPPKEALSLEKLNEMAAKHIKDISGYERPIKPMGEDHEFIVMCRAIEAASAPNKQLVEALWELCRGYVRLLESGRDKIIELGGDCDPVDRMEASDPELRKARAALAAAGEVQS